MRKMTLIRSALFNLYFTVVSLPYVVLGSGLFFYMPRVFHSFTARCWGRAVVWGAKVFGGVDYVVEGAENLPKDSHYIIAAKHQSAYETFLFNVLFKNVAFILKRELVLIPFVGWQIFLTGAIPIDRRSGAKAMKRILAGTQSRLARKQPVIIFPEGTRTKIGEKTVYHPGIALLYNHFPDTPVIPVAINSGKFWHKNTGLKRTGTVTVKIMPAIEHGLNKKEFMTALEEKIEEGCREID